MEDIKKIIIFGLIVWALIFFYKTFLAETFEPFFKQKKENVDFLQKKIPDYNIEK